MMPEKHYKGIALIRLVCICYCVSALFASCGGDEKGRPLTVDVTRWYTAQRLDHLSKDDTRTWKQRYFVSESEGDPLKDPYNQFQFLYYLSTQDGIDLSGSLTGSLFPVQSNDPNCEEDACSIGKVCSDYMLNSGLGEPIDRLASLWSLYAGQECISVDYQTATIAPLLDTSLSSWPNRSWEYQACNEFGFFQTCDPGTECPFTQDPHILTVEACSYPCQRVFGINANDIQERIAETNAYYGGWNPVGTRIMSVSGSIDPWHALGVCRTPDCQPLPEQPVLWVEGASHHFWTHAPGYYTPPLSKAVVRAQESIKAQVLTWLKE